MRRTLPALLLALALAACVASPPAPPRPPNAIGMRLDGLVARSAAGFHLLRDSNVPYALVSSPSIPLDAHVGQYVEVTGSLGDSPSGPSITVASLVVTRGGEMDRIIDAITRAPCEGVSLTVREGYRLDAHDDTREGRFPVHVRSRAGAFQVWVRREGSAFRVDQILRSEGKVLVPACAPPPPPAATGRAPL